MPNPISKIIVYTERVLADLTREYPNLSHVGKTAAGGFAVAGTVATLQAAQRWLTERGHKHEAH